MAYGTADMLPAVRERILASRALSEAVTLLGRIEHSQLEDIYNSSDYFVLGSHHEGSGFSLAEAMACGVVPVVTDIPSFRVMTDGGRIGACWRPGSSESFAEKFLEVVRQPLEQLSHKARSFFQSQLSYKAIARDSMRAYREVIAARQKPRMKIGLIVPGGVDRSGRILVIPVLLALIERLASQPRSCCC